MVLISQVANVVLSETQSSNVLGGWKVEVSFSDRPTRSLRFEALAEGKGSIQLLVPQPVQIGSDKASPATWTQGNDGMITFSGPVQFPLGNVGLERGRLVLKGKLRGDGTITGEAEFFLSLEESANPTGQVPTRGTFRATRVRSGG